jgi:hypothetical protein
MEPSISFSHESNLFTVPLTNIDEIWTKGERLAISSKTNLKQLNLIHAFDKGEKNSNYRDKSFNTRFKIPLQVTTMTNLIRNNCTNLNKSLHKAVLQQKTATKSCEWNSPRERDSTSFATRSMRELPFKIFTT